MTESELRYRTLIEQLPIVTYIDALDDRSSNIYTSPQLEPLLGYSVEEWQADEELFVQILHPDDRERVLAQIQESNASGERFESEYRLIARDGRVVWFHDVSVVVRDESGAPLYSQGYLLDITDRKTARDALAESEARFAAFMDTTPAIAFAKDAEGRYVYANARWLEVFGHTQDELLGHTDAELFPDSAEDFRAHDAAAIEAGCSVSKIDRIEAGGTARTLMTLKFPFRDSSGEEFVGGVALDITEREQAEQELHATTRLLESIVQSAPVAIVTSDRDGLVTGWNPAAEAMFGWSRAEVLGKDPPHFVPGDSDGFDSRKRAQSGRTVADAEGRRLRRDGTIVSVRYAKAPLHDATGEVAGTTAILTDVTERKRAERRLSAQHAVARALAESTTLDEAAPRILEEVCGALGWEIGGLWTVDPAVERLRLASIWHSADRRFQRFVDESWSLELGRGEGFPGAVWETGETRWFADVAGSSRSRAAAVAYAGLHGALAAPAVSGGEVLGVLELFSTRVWEPDDDLVAMLTSVGSQVGQFLRRTQADREVREREERFRTLVANLPGAIYRCAADEDWTMSFMSDVIRVITGYPASDFIDSAGRSFASVIHPDDRAMVSQLVGAAVRRKEPFELEYRIAHADGSVRWVAEKGQPIIGPGGAVLWLDGAIFDVTEQHALDRLKDEFVALVSHELRTPLTSILGYLELVLEGEAGEISDDQARFLAIIERNARRLLRLVGDLLFVAQIEAGHLVIEREPCDLAQLAADCIEAARPRASEQEVDLTLESDTRVELLGDRTRLAQLLDNLVSNAIKFTPEGGLVRVRLTRHERLVAVGVSDTGIGISPEEQASLFQRFFRSVEATRRAIPGTGLGLTITKAIVDAHGGSIDVESEVGTGTTFVVVLPVEPAGEDGA